MRKVVLMCACVMVLAWSNPAFAESRPFELTVDKKKAGLGERIELGLTFNGVQSIPALELPDLEGFKGQYLGPSTRMSIVNGQMSSSVTHLYVLVGVETGTFNIGPFSFDYQGDTYACNGVQIEVIDRSAGLPANAPGQGGAVSGTSPQNDIKERVTVLLEPSKTEMYLHEVVPVKIKVVVNGLSMRYDAAPQLTQTGFSVEPFTAPEQYQAQVGGIPVTVLEFTTNVTPLKEGATTLGPVSFSFNVVVRSQRRRRPAGFADFFDSDFFDDMFGGVEYVPMTVQSSPAAVTVKPFPEEGKPVSFHGAVGDFAMDVSCAPHDVWQGDPVTLTATISGKGNLKTVTGVQLGPAAGLKMYEPHTRQENGRVIVEQVVIPTSEQIQEIPGLSFSFFDPAAGRYQTLTRGPFPVTVLHRPQEAPASIIDAGGRHISVGEDTIGRDIVFIKPSPGAFAPRGTYLYTSAVYLWMHTVPLAGLMVLLWVNARRRRLENDITYARRIKAPRHARAGMRQAREFLRQGKPELFYDGIFRTLREYLGNRFHLPAAGMTADVVDEHLCRRGVPDSVLALIRTLFGECDRARYASSSMTRDDMQKAFRALEQVIDQCERTKPVPVPPTKLALFFMLGWLLCSPAQARAQQEPVEQCTLTIEKARDLFTTANTFYRNGDYPSAAREYEKILNGGIESGNLYFNLGNSYYKQGALGRALLHYERAAYLLPADADLAANRAYVRGILNLAGDEPGGGIRRLLTGPFGFLSIDAHVVLVSVLYVLVLFLWGWAVMRPLARRKLSLVLGAVVVCSAVTAWSLVLRVRERSSAALVVAAEAPARFEPSESATVHYTLREGTRVEVLSSSGAWTKLRRADGKSGWVESGKIEKVKS